MQKATKSILAAGLVLLSLQACQPGATQQADTQQQPVAEVKPETFATAIEAYHQKEAWDSKTALAFDTKITFGGQTYLDCRITMLTSTGQVRIDLNDSLNTRMVWTGEEATVSPADSPAGGARFHVLTWPYFVAAPFKLQDPGAKLEETGTAQVGEQAAATAKLTFDSGIGDSPDDWYVVFKDAETAELLALSYIVTFGKSVSDAEADPHAILYNNYTEVDGVRLATEWSFTGWRQDSGFSDEIGSATLSNLSFVEPASDFFDVPADHRVEALPPSGE